MKAAFANFDDSTVKAPSSALKITKNGGRDSFFGKKYQVETVCSLLIRRSFKVFNESRTFIGVRR